VSPLRRLLIGAIVAVAAAAGYAGGRAAFRPTQRVVQPIAFNHQKHVRTLEPLTDSPEEAKIFELVKAGKVDVFRKLFRLPDHAFYTHRRHVVVAKLPCERCHGAIADTTSPPERPLVRISMEFCLGCHQSSGASSACTSCHR
jgi:predicted CXXCH cytochrome family protein